MIEEKYEDLMWLKIDGAISDEDQGRLEQFLASNPAAIEHFESLKSLTHFIDTVPEVDPPTALRQRIDSAIDADRYAVRTPEPRLAFSLSGITRFFARRRGFGFGLVAAAGVLVGIVGSQLVNNGAPGKRPLDTALFYGTINPDLARTRIGEFRLDADEARGNISFRRNHEVLVSEIEITSDRRVEVALTFDAKPLAVGASRETGNPQNRVTVDGSSVRILNDGEGRYNLVFRIGEDMSAPIAVRVVSGDAVLLDEQVVPGDPD